MNSRFFFFFVLFSVVCIAFAADENSKTSVPSHEAGHEEHKEHGHEEEHEDHGHGEEHEEHEDHGHEEEHEDHKEHGHEEEHEEHKEHGHEEEHEDHKEHGHGEEHEGHEGHGHGEDDHKSCKTDADCTVDGCTCIEKLCSMKKMNDEGKLHEGHAMCAAEPEESAEAEDEDDGASECFPSDAFVTVEGGVSKLISDLKIGEKVLVSAGTFSEVIMFTHNDASARSKFIELSAGDSKIQLTPGHFIYASGSLVAAKDVRVGDVLSLSNGSEAAVRSIRVVRKDGLYNPQTVQGDIIVNGVKASTYTTAVEPKAAHSMLAPVRLLNSLVGGVSA